ncbi:lysozyme [Mucilaginibacter gotjawali]|uniref:Lysozyme n=2 Tax=Mucilaginibacter gotjawali TaxID=1550579 RepID=A0A110B1U0_9SPHI|nr:lysozyme [Mucilaginibacter gotjawali]MBB3057270.1 lysozyme [Mucilaginibacter gotjawali]BAU52962.1 Lysozyme RrrD [Mucilaginibacter gotjawali]
MNLSKNGFRIIKNFEGLRLTAYRDVAGMWTIGYGSTHYHDGRAVKPGDKLADDLQADALFANTLGQYEDAVNRYVKVPLSQNQFDALVSFTYNEGTGALKESTLLVKLNEKNYAEAAAHFLAWDKITDPKTGQKVVCDTLVQRRREESQLFMQPDAHH